MDKRTSYQTLKNITKNPNEDTTQRNINLYEFNETAKPHLLRLVSQRNLDSTYGKQCAPYSRVYGHFM